jgi:Cd2+/Zn2+-exporting ATPase/Cu+-exporting ATPase
MSQATLTTTEAEPRSTHAEGQNHDHGPEDHDHSLEWVDLVRIGLVALACLASWLGVWQHIARWLGLLETVANFDVIALTATLLGGYPIFKDAVANLLARRMTMELSMTIALAAALAIGEFFTALVIVLFVLVAEVLEGLTVGRGRRAIKDLLDLLPQQAVVRRDGGTQEVGAAEVQVGDVVLVKPGARVPVDGVVVAGNSFVDQAPVPRLLASHCRSRSCPAAASMPGPSTNPASSRSAPRASVGTPPSARSPRRWSEPNSPVRPSRRPPTGWLAIWSISPSAAPP